MRPPPRAFQDHKTVTKRLRKRRVLSGSDRCALFITGVRHRGRQKRSRERGCAHPHSGPVPGRRKTEMREGGGEGGRGSCGGGTRVGQTFPWQDPRDTAEARVQPVKERLRAQQSISGSHFHNKWSSHSFCSRSLAPSLARTHVIGECIHSRLISTRQRRVTETGRKRGRGGRGEALRKHKVHVYQKHRHDVSCGGKIHSG